MSAERLPLVQAAFVVARRDFGAILFSRAFFFFLLGPLFPILIGVMAGSVGQRVSENIAPPQIGLAMAAPDIDAMLRARQTLASELGPMLPEMVALERLAPGERFDAAARLMAGQGDLAAVLTGTPAAPELTATSERLERWRGSVSLVAATALRTSPTTFPDVAQRTVVTSGASVKQARLRTAQAGLTVLFLLIIMLAGMVLSNLVEEKANKVIEILAAAIPMDAVFLGKLFAMLAVSLVGIAVWGSVIAFLTTIAGIGAEGGGAFNGIMDFSNLTPPGVGWPLFFALGVLYFAMGYLLLGSVFLAVGSMATTVREVQTLSMPVTMAQLLIFFLASVAMSQPGSPLELAGAAFPLSSPFVMLARAAQDGALWPHLLGLGWQALWVAIFVRLGATLFRRRVMKSGPQMRSRRGLFARLRRGERATPARSSP
ncbi:MAG TPA: ABC transporter permease [Croceibacterium sp.]|nr:ABC transporter permease [Croceibacterium sp.]